MAFVAAGESEARKRALLQNQQMENAATNIIGGLTGLANQAEARRKALLETEIKTQERIDKANAEEAKNVAEWNKNERELEFKQAESEKDRLFKQDQAVKDRELKAEIAKLAAQGKGEITPYQQRMLELKEKSLGAKGAGKALGEQVPAGQATTLGEAESAVKNISDLNTLIETANIPKGKLAGRYSQLLGSMELGDTGVEASQVQNAADSAAQVIGTYLEGGKLTAEDYNRYKKLVPSITESSETRQAKAANLIKMIENKRAGQVSGLKQLGFNVSGAEGSAQSKPKLTPEQRQALIDSLRGQ